MIEVISDAKLFAPWLANRLGYAEVWKDGAGYGFLYNDELVGAVVFTEFTGRDIHVHIASQNPVWFTRPYLKVISEYPFVHCGVERVTALIDEKNERSRRLFKGWGGCEEGRLRNYIADGQDAIVCGMLKRECRYLNV